MKKPYFLLPLALCACGNNDNPQCLKNIKEVQVFEIIGEQNDGPAALAVNCDIKMPMTDGGCIGNTVLLPQGGFPSLQKDQKIRPPRHHCFVQVGEFEYTRNDGKKDKVPVVEFRYNKKTLSETDWADMLEDGRNKTYTDCIHYAGIEFKNAKAEDNAKACKCFSDYMWDNYKEIRNIKDDVQRTNKLESFGSTFHKYIEQNCGKVPAKTLREMPKD